MWTRSLFIAVGALVLLTGCAFEPEPVEVHDPFPSDSSLEMDKAIYTASCQGEGYHQRCTVTLTMTYTNQTDATTYLDLCYPDDTSPIYSVSSLTQEESAYNSIWACVEHDKFIEVLPGEQRVDTLTVYGPNSRDSVTGKTFGLLEGRLQILYEASTCPDELDPCELPRETATSNVFTAMLPD